MVKYMGQFIHLNLKVLDPSGAFPLEGFKHVILFILSAARDVHIILVRMILHGWTTTSILVKGLLLLLFKYNIDCLKCVVHDYQYSEY